MANVLMVNQLLLLSIQNNNHMKNNYNNSLILLITLILIALVIVAQNLSQYEKTEINILNLTSKNNYLCDTTNLKFSKSGAVIQRKIQTSDSTYIIEFLDSYYGYVSDIIQYTNNKLDGLEQTFAPNGVIIHQIQWKNGVIVGTEQFFYEDGSIDWSRQYDTLGVLHGDLIVYFRNGVIQSKLPFVQGKKNGTGYYYAQDGGLLRMYTYLNDTLKKIEYLENGIIEKVEYPNIFEPYFDN